MMKYMGPSVDRIISLLRQRGVVPSQRLVSELNISRATLSRLVSKGSQSIVRLGQTRNVQYGLLKELPGIGSQLPLFRVTESGGLKPLGHLGLFHRNFYFDPKSERIFEGLPPQIADLTPQGFMGRIFGRTHSESLGISSNPSDWSNDQILVAVARRGEDLSGQLILGQESAERWSNHSEDQVQVSNYSRLARAALQGQPAGSSAGGEQPKFTALVEGSQRIVKFVVLDGSSFSVRWRDLLLCESIALDVLSKNQFDTNRVRVHECDSMLFLDVERFDRIGVRGRRAVITLAALDDFYFGIRDHWTGAAQRLLMDQRLSWVEARKLRLLDAFGALIADSDRHFYNIAFFAEFDVSQPLEPTQLRLAPAFDKLPMFFAPAAGQVVSREWKTPVPSPDWIDVWGEAVRMASEFWERIEKNATISAGFRKIAQDCASKVVRL